MDSSSPIQPACRKRATHGALACVQAFIRRDARMHACVHSPRRTVARRRTVFPTTGWASLVLDRRVVLVAFDAAVFLVEPPGAEAASWFIVTDDREDAGCFFFNRSDERTESMSSEHTTF